MKSEGKVVVISGPSGAGKTTIVRQVLQRTGAAFSVSATTRALRPGEVDGRDYLFIDRPRFGEMVRQGQLLEWAEVFGQGYGTPAEPVRQALAAGQTIVLDIDVQGALQVHRLMPQAEFVLILPPSQEQLAERLKGRGSEDAQALRRRLAKADQEIQAARDSGVYNHCVVNEDLEKAIRQVVDIIQQEHPKR